MFRRYFIVLIFALSMLSPNFVKASDTQLEKSLNARAALLMDAETGRILYTKNAEEKMAVASTTKIVTCILILEEGNLSDYTCVSETAASQPRVHAGYKSGECYRIKDLLYAMMLESHNDAAVCLAEYLSGSIDAFSEKMNALAKKVGCEQSLFIMPNGLDAYSEKYQSENGASAEDMAKLLRYCVMQSEKKEEFIKLTQTDSHSYHNYVRNEEDQWETGNRTFMVQNTNRFLYTEKGAYTGKTGFTNKAGYCYVGACMREGKNLIYVVLGCGWPPKKELKWRDSEKLINYGMEQFELVEFLFGADEIPEICVENGAVRLPTLKQKYCVRTIVTKKKGNVLMKQGEKIESRVKIEKTLPLPVQIGQKIGEIEYNINDTVIAKVAIRSAEEIGVRTFQWYFDVILQFFFSYL